MGDVETKKKFDIVASDGSPLPENGTRSLKISPHIFAT